MLGCTASSHVLKKNQTYLGYKLQSNFYQKSIGILNEVNSVKRGKGTGTWHA